MCRRSNHIKFKSTNLQILKSPLFHHFCLSPKTHCKNHNHSTSGIQVQALYLCGAFLLILSDSLFPLYFPWLSLPVKLCPLRVSHNLSLPISARPTGSKHTLPTCLSHCSSLHWPHSVSTSQLPAVSEESKRDSRLAVLGCITPGFLHW